MSAFKTKSHPHIIKIAVFSSMFSHKLIQLIKGFVRKNNDNCDIKNYECDFHDYPTYKYNPKSLKITNFDGIIFDKSCFEESQLNDNTKQSGIITDGYRPTWFYNKSTDTEKINELIQKFMEAAEENHIKEYDLTEYPILFRPAALNRQPERYDKTFKNDIVNYLNERYGETYFFRFRTIGLDDEIDGKGHTVITIGYQQKTRFSSFNLDEVEISISEDYKSSDKELEKLNELFDEYFEVGFEDFDNDSIGEIVCSLNNIIKSESKPEKELENKVENKVETIEDKLKSMIPNVKELFEETTKIREKLMIKSMNDYKDKIIKTKELGLFDISIEFDNTDELLKVIVKLFEDEGYIISYDEKYVIISWRLN